MSVPKAILLGSVIVASSIFAHLGYTIHRDHVSAEETRQAREQEQRNAIAEYRRGQGKAAWDVAVQGLDFQLESWLESEAKPGSDISIPMVMLKIYSHSDVVWVDDRHVQAKGYLNATKGRTEQWFTWEKEIFLTDGGEWTDPKLQVAKFAPVNPSEDQRRDWLVRVIRWRK